MDHLEIIYTLHETDNHANTLSLNFYKRNALSAFNGWHQGIEGNPFLLENQHLGSHAAGSVICVL